MGIVEVLRENVSGGWAWISVHRDDLEKLIALYDAADAGNEHVELEDIGAKYYTISMQSWDRIEIALNAIKEAE